MRRALLCILSLCLVLSVGVGVASAQTAGTLAYGSAQVGTVSAALPLVFYTFPASAGDLVAVDVIALTPGFDPSVSLLNPSQQPIAANDNDPARPGALDARLTRRLDANGAYALLIGGVNGTTGDFLIKLNGLAAGNPPALPPGSAAVADFTASPLPQFIAIPADPAAPVTITLSADPSSFAFAAQVFGPDGALIGHVDGAPQASLTVPAASGSAVLVLQPTNPDATGRVQISTGGALPGGSLPGPVATQEPGAPPPADICTVSSGGSVNLRSGAGTGFPTVGTLNPGTFLTVQGVSPDRGWYAVAFNGQQAWVSGTVVSLNGPCGNLPTVQPPAGQAQPTTGRRRPPHRRTTTTRWRLTATAAVRSASRFRTRPVTAATGSR